MGWYWRNGLLGAGLIGASMNQEPPNAKPSEYEW